MKYAIPESNTNAIAKQTINEKHFRTLIIGSSISKYVQHSLVLFEYYSDIVAIGRQNWVFWGLNI